MALASISTGGAASPALAPIFTREELLNVENEVAKNAPEIVLRNSKGSQRTIPNPCPGMKTSDLPQGGHARLNSIQFRGEGDYNRAEAAGDLANFHAVTVATAPRHGPSKTLEETREAFAKALRDFNGSDECWRLTNIIVRHVAGAGVNKVVGFGHGTFSYGDKIKSHMREHVALLAIAEAAQQATDVDVRLVVQDPWYTSVDVAILAELGFEVATGYGAAGFAEVDENAIALCHHPGFPFREIMADLARPVMLFMRHELEFRSYQCMSDLEVRVMFDRDTERSRDMMTGYSVVPNFQSPAMPNDYLYVRKGIQKGLLPLLGRLGLRGGRWIEAPGRFWDEWLASSNAE